MYDIIELNDKTVSQLRQLAESLSVSDFEGMKKQDLIYKILDKQALIAPGTKSELKQKSTEPKTKRARSGKKGEEIESDLPTTEPMEFEAAAPLKTLSNRKADTIKISSQKRNELLQAKEEVVKQETIVEIEKTEQNDSLSSSKEEEEEKGEEKNEIKVQVSPPNNNPNQRRNEERTNQRNPNGGSNLNQNQQAFNNLNSPAAGNQNQNTQNQNSQNQIQNGNQANIPNGNQANIPNGNQNNNPQNNNQNSNNPNNPNYNGNRNPRHNPKV